MLPRVDKSCLYATHSLYSVCFRITSCVKGQSPIFSHVGAFLSLMVKINSEGQFPMAVVTAGDCPLQTACSCIKLQWFHFLEFLNALKIVCLLVV